VRVAAKAVVAYGERVARPLVREKLDFSRRATLPTPMRSLAPHSHAAARHDPSCDSLEVTKGIQGSCGGTDLEQWR
jgi:hypothetical protein